MKKLTYLSVLFVFFLAACQQNKHEGFSISGQFQEADGHKVFLNKVHANNLLAVDSATIDSEGHFEFLGTNEHTRFYIVSVVSKDRKVTHNIQLLVGKKDQVVLSGNLAGNLKANYAVSGSKDSELIKVLNNKLRSTSSTLDSIAAVFRKAANENAVDSAKKAELDQKNSAVKMAHRAFSKKLIADNDSSLVAVMALFQHLGPYETVFNIQDDFELYESVQRKLQKLYPESELVKSLQMTVTSQKRKVAKQTNTLNAVEVGSLAPEIVLETPDGEKVALSSLRGRYVLLDFWASWCRPCRRESPVLVKNYKKYKRKKFTIYQVSLDKDKEAWERAIKDDKLTWYHVSDLKHWSSAPAKLYNVRTIPSNFLIDPDGKIAATQLRGDRLEEKLREIYLY